MLKYLLGLKNVKNYDGNWTEFGNLIGAPSERIYGPGFAAPVAGLVARSCVATPEKRY